MEILIAYLQNFKCFFIVCSVVSIIGAVFFFICYVANSFDADISQANAWQKDHEKEKACARRAKMLMKIFLWVMVPFTLLACIPSIDTLWEVRIGLIKLELASPANVNAGVEEISRIARVLECKYLNSNCPKEEKK